MSDVVQQLPAGRSGRIAGKRQDLPRSTPVRTAIIALGICAAAIAGCAAPGQSETATPPAVSGPGVVTPMPPPALTPTAYQETLQSTNSAVAPAFDRLAAAGSSEDARAALDQASSAASEAARTLDVDPPAEVLAMHRDLRTGLQQLATDLSQLSGQVTSMELCAPPSILASVSNATGMNNLRTVREALGSGQLGASYQWGDFLPAPQPLPERRLANGRLLDNQRRNGRGQLKIDNGAEHDAVVKLVQGGRSMVSVYVGKGASTTVGQISDGTYELFYTSGADWDDGLKTFTRSCQFTRFEQTAEFATKSVKGGIEYTVQTIGLKPRIGGNARTEPVPVQSFPR
jgi:hypothetical protein